METKHEARLMRRMTAGERHTYPDGRMIREVMLDGEAADLTVNDYGVAVCAMAGGPVFYMDRPDMRECERSHKWPLWRDGVHMAAAMPTILSSRFLIQSGFEVQR